MNPSEEMEFGNRFELMERAYRDPFIANIFKEAVSYTHLMQETSLTHEEMGDVVRDLDAQWVTLMGSEVQFTGQARLTGFDSDGDEMTDTVFLDDTRVISQGFDVEHIDQYVGGEAIGTVPRVVLSLVARAQDIYPDDIDDEHSDAHMVFFADIETSQIEVVRGVSDQRAEAWLELHCPELFAALEYCIFNEDGTEADALLALRGFDLSQFEDISEEMTRDCIQVYLNSKLQLDQLVPYEVRLDGSARQPVAEDTSIYRVSSDGVLAQMTSIVVLPEFEAMPRDGKWAIGVDSLVATSDRTATPTRLVIDLDAIDDMSSMREEYFSRSGATSRSTT